MAISEVRQKENALLKRLFQSIILCLLPFFFIYSSYAQNNSIRSGFYTATSLGYAITEHKYQNIVDSDDGLSFGLQAGLVNKDVTFGVELEITNLNKYDETPQGESTDNLLCFLNVSPFRNNPFYITGGGGIGFYHNNIADDHNDDTGTIWFLGCGYEFMTNEKSAWGPQLRYYKGNFANVEYSVVEMSLKFHLYFPR
jgi:hypothetical protein